MLPSPGWTKVEPPFQTDLPPNRSARDWRSRLGAVDARTPLLGLGQSLAAALCAFEHGRRVPRRTEVSCKAANCCSFFFSAFNPCRCASPTSETCRSCLTPACESDRDVPPSERTIPPPSLLLPAWCSHLGLDYVECMGGDPDASNAKSQVALRGRRAWEGCVSFAFFRVRFPALLSAVPVAGL